MSVSILIADDQPIVRSLLVRLVQRANPHARIIDVATGQAALDMFQQLTPHFVILDHGLPDVNGFTVLRSLKAQPCTPYIIVVTGDSTLEDEARTIGADEVWLKPMEVTTLLPHLTELLHHEVH